MNWITHIIILVVFFLLDHLYWEYDGISLIRNFPRPVRFLGLQNQHIGAAVWWERTGKSYFFQGNFILNSCFYRTFIWYVLHLQHRSTWCSVIYSTVQY